MNYKDKVHLHVEFVHYPVSVRVESMRVAFSTVNQLSGSRLVSDVMLLIAHALVLLIRGGLFD